LVVELTPAPGAAACDAATRRGRGKVVGRALVALALALLAARPGTVQAAGLTDPASPADALWRIVSNCLDAPRPSGTSYCSCPAFTATCCGDAEMPDAEMVWAESTDFVAFRDIKACGCPASFVAGLALPRARLGGIEDPGRPDGLWPFAWDVARRRITDERQIGLVINPQDVRTQNQMHVHLLRLKHETRALLDGIDPPAGGTRLDTPPALVVRLSDLEHVFRTAADAVGDAAVAHTGILVARAHDAGYLALLTDRSSPQVLTENRCR
jgi:CDP-diacylglycerol pyrophosphatase